MGVESEGRELEEKNAASAGWEENKNGKKSGIGRSGWEVSKDWWSEAAEDGSIIADTRQYSLQPCQAEIKILSRVEQWDLAREKKTFYLLLIGFRSLDEEKCQGTHIQCCWINGDVVRFTEMLLKVLKCLRDLV